MFDDVEFAIIGGGFGGLLMGARLREAGFESIRMVESAGDFGGTWYWNRYPGAMCDVESLLLPAAARRARLHAEAQILLRAGDPRAQPRHRPALRPLRRRAVADRRSPSCAGTRTTARWIISTNRGDRFTAQYVAMANGPLSRPKLPGIPGINDFKGHTFHTSRWDYRYTGGDSHRRT